MRFRRVLAGAATAGLLMTVAIAGPAKADNLTGAGSSFANKFITSCTATYTKHSITYSPAGSGTGRSGFTAGTYDFGASDAATALTGAAVGKHVYVPLVGGPIAIPYNLPEIAKAGQLRVDSKALANIFRGKIQMWNDPYLKGLQTPAVAKALPAKRITVLIRSGSSGTSENFSDYLNQTAKADWPKAKNTTFTNSAPSLPRGYKTGSTNQVLTSLVKSTKSSIAFIDFGDALSNKLTVAAVKNANGEFVAPSATTASKFLGEFSDVSETAGIKIDYTKKVAGAYNVALFVYGIGPTNGGPTNRGTGAAVKETFTYFINECGDNAAKLGYAPLTGAVQKQALAIIAKIG